MTGRSAPHFSQVQSCGTAGDDFFAPFQVLGQTVPARMVGTGLLGPRQRLLLLLLRQLGFLGHFLGRDAGFFEQQGSLQSRELLALGAEALDIEQTDLLVLKFDHTQQPTVFGLGLGQSLGQIGCRL